MKKFLLLSVLFLWLISPLQGMAATVVTYSDFSDTSELTLTGSAAASTTTDGSVLRLTPAASSKSGSAFGTETINVASFSTYFQFRITNPGGSLFDGNTETGADGIVFVVQNVSASIGSDGQGIGYEGIHNSVGVEFDTWHNSYNNDPDSNHIGIDSNGSVDHTSSDTVSVSTRFDDGNIWHAWIDYDGTTLEVRANQDGHRDNDALLSMSIDISSIVGQDYAWVGFTSATGADWGNHDILSWTYRDYYDPIDNTVPIPSSIILLGLGLLGISKYRRKRR